MPERVYSFLVVLLLMFSGEIFGQPWKQKATGYAPCYAVNKKVADLKSGYSWSPLGITLADKKSDKYVTLRVMPFMVIQAPAIKNISPTYYSDKLGFVCKKEWQLEKLTTIPFRFRVGSLDYVNYLEQKPNAIKPTQ